MLCILIVNKFWVKNTTIDVQHRTSLPIEAIIIGHLEAEEEEECLFDQMFGPEIYN